MRVGEYFLFLVLSSILLINSMGVSSTTYSSSYVLLFCIVAFTKSAQIPFSGWLPKAIRAPTPTRALVHRSTLVTAGLVVLMVYRELFMQGHSMSLLMYSGFFTIVAGRLLALVEKSLKKVVAFRTLSQMGLAIITYGLGNFHAGLVHLISHGFAKRLLFMQVGYIIHTRFNQQNIRLYQGVGSSEGIMRLQLLCTLFSLCGTSFSGGMLRKEVVVELMNTNNIYGILLLGMLSSIFITYVYSYIIYRSLFNSGGTVSLLSHPSVIVVLVTMVEVVLVIIHYS